MILIGISGAINHGKTSLAEYLKAASPSAVHLESSDIIMEVANALRASGPSPKAERLDAVITWLQAIPAILATSTHNAVSFDALQITPERFTAAPDEFATLVGYLHLMSLQPELLDKPINASNKDEFRTLLQWLGGYMSKHASGRLWYDEIVRRGQASGCELVIAGGVRLPGDADCLRASGGVIVDIVRPEMAEQDVQDVTERERASIAFDTTIINDGSLEALRITAAQLYEDLAHASLQPQYLASSVEPPARTGLSFN